MREKLGTRRNMPSSFSSSSYAKDLLFTSYIVIIHDRRNADYIYARPILAVLLARWIDFANKL